MTAFAESSSSTTWRARSSQPVTSLDKASARAQSGAVRTSSPICDSIQTPPDGCLSRDDNGVNGHLIHAVNQKHARWGLTRRLASEGLTVVRRVAWAFWGDLGRRAEEHAHANS